MASMTGCLLTPNSALTSSIEIRDPGRVLAAEQSLLELVEDDLPQALACAAHRRLDHVDSFVSRRLSLYGLDALSLLPAAAGRQAARVRGAGAAGHVIQSQVST